MTYTLPKNITGWTWNHAKQNYWRVAAFYDFDDLVQDGLMVCYKCLSEYGVPGIEIDAPNFMALVKSSFYNHIGDLLRKNRGVVEITIHAGDLSSVLSESDALDRVAIPDDVSEHDFAMLLADLPEHLRAVVELFLKDDTAKQLRKSLRVRLGQPSETMSDRLVKMAGFPTYLDFETELRAFLWEREAETI